MNKRHAYILWLSQGPVDVKAISGWFETGYMQFRIGHWIMWAPSLFFTTDLDVARMAGHLEGEWPRLKEMIYTLTRVDDVRSVQGRLPMGVWNLLSSPDEASPTDSRFSLAVPPAPQQLYAAPATTPATSELAAPKGDYLYGVPVPGHAGFVRSPHSPDKITDVRGYTPGVLVKDPYTGKLFLVP